MSRTGRLAAALATTLVLATAGSATADPSPSDRVVGGERLGQPDVQVSSGAPKLPDGLTGMSWLVADADTGDVLAAYRPHLRLPRPAP